MMKSIIKKIFFSRRILNASTSFDLNQLNLKADRSLILSALNLIKNFDYSKTIKNFKEVEFSVFSQWGDDGIIQYLINKIEIPVKSFIEFGVENYQESNTRFLLINDNWSGLVMDSSKKNINYIKNDSISWKYSLLSKEAFINSENINDLISSSGFNGEIGILSIDIDGNDYWIWKAINVVNPVIAIVEYNSVLGADRSITVPYKKTFSRTKEHYSNLYFGASLSALCFLAEEKGYYFIGSDSHGVNAYFVRKDKIGALKPITAKEGFVPSKFAQSRDRNGTLNHISYQYQLEVIKGLEVYNVETNKKEFI
ncbi:MAG: hypothetical protein NTX97_14585 [Bacteroidetes bacterium]|nr:hypothetical protein [Bacteroidota bacterium]